MDENQQWSGLWRGSAMEQVPYTEDFQEALLVFPEMLDGAIGQGGAKDVNVTFSFLDETNGELVVEDNGRGIKNQARLLAWAAPTSQDNLHRNGHGLKKAMTKFAPKYDTAKWEITYRKPGQNLITIAGPFKGGATSVNEDEDNQDTTTLMPSGTRIKVCFERSVLGCTNTAETLLAASKEIIQTRFSEEVLRKVRFVIRICDIGGKQTTLDSHQKGKELHSFRWYVQKGVSEGKIECICRDQEHVSEGAKWKLARYRIKPKGTSSYELKTEFPVYGQKNMHTQRVYISLEERTIEAAKYYQFIGRKAPHNDDNGTIVFVDFVSPELSKKPQPCTTKVSMYQEDPIYKVFLADFTRILTTPEIDDDNSSVESSAVPEQPAPAKRDRVNKVEDALGIKLREFNKVMHVKGGDDVWRPVSEYMLVLRPTSNTALNTA